MAAKKMSPKKSGSMPKPPKPSPDDKALREQMSDSKKKQEMAAQMAQMSALSRKPPKKKR